MGPSQTCPVDYQPAIHREWFRTMASAECALAAGVLPTRSPYPSEAPARESGAHSPRRYASGGRAPEAFCQPGLRRNRAHPRRSGVRKPGARSNESAVSGALRRLTVLPRSVRYPLRFPDVRAVDASLRGTLSTRKPRDAPVSKRVTPLLCEHRTNRMARTRLKHRRWPMWA